MDLKKINELAGSLDEKYRSGILELINLKTNDVMEKALAKMDAIGASIRSEIVQIDTLMNARFMQLGTRNLHI